jgi:hypothetical protein
MRFFVTGHLITKIQTRFGVHNKNEILAFLKEALSEVKKTEENRYRITLLNETTGTCIKAQKREINGDEEYTLMTILPIEDFSNYQIRGENYKGIQIKNYSDVPLLFNNADLQKQNTIKTLEELRGVQTNESCKTKKSDNPTI